MATQLEGAINNLDKKITEYLVLLSEKPLSPTDSEKHSVLAGVVGDIERVGDHVENLVELVDFQISNRVSLSDDALAELNEMLELTISTLHDAVEALTNFDTELAQTVIAKERKIDQMERVLRKRHVLRLNERSCSGDASIIFVDMVSNLERIGDHAVNIADGVLGEQGKVNLKQSL